MGECMCTICIITRPGSLHVMVLFAVCLCYACVVDMGLYFRAALCAWPVWFLGCWCHRGLWVVPGFVSLWCGRLGTLPCSVVFSCCYYI